MSTIKPTYLMKSIKARSGKPSAECILMVLSLPLPCGYRLSEAAAALNAAGVLALLPTACFETDERDQVSASVACRPETMGYLVPRESRRDLVIK